MVATAKGIVSGTMNQNMPEALTAARSVKGTAARATGPCSASKL